MQVSNNNEAILYFHQGWTDIFNSLSLIKHYHIMYTVLHLVMRKDSQKVIDFYIKDFKNVVVHYIEKEILENMRLSKNIDGIFKLTNLDKNNIYFIGIGLHDTFRKDEFKNKYISEQKKYSFEKCFYTSYDIPYTLRIYNFEFKRDFDLEESIYDRFINTYGSEYILYHEVIKNYDKNKKIVNLNKSSEIFFDMIKVLENSIEIHLLDSVWGAFVYLLDAKYRLFKNKKIFLYAKRGYKSMFEEPVKLNNWIFV
mgnify:CR=1 FL=1|jgi:hypothetical protein